MLVRAGRVRNRHEGLRMGMGGSVWYEKTTGKDLDAFRTTAETCWKLLRGQASWRSNWGGIRGIA
jgi:hypothetical protein